MPAAPRRSAFRPLASLLVTLAAALAAAPLLAQAPGDRPLSLGAPRPAAPTAPPELLTLPSETVPVRYSPGALDRASLVLERLEALAQDFHRWHADVEGLHGVVLGPDDWAASGLRRPYGLPDRADANGVALPAWGNEASVALWRRLWGGPLPVGADEPLRGTAEEGASLALADVLGQVELARLVADRAAPRAEAWARELLAHVLALAAFELHESGRAAEIADLYARLAASSAVHPAPGPRDFRDGLPVDDWLATQPVFYRGAVVVVAKDGTNAVRRLLGDCRKNGGERLMSSLLERYTALGPWLRGE